MGPAAFFDVDGTLTDTNLFSALGYYLSSMGNPVSGALRAAWQMVRVPALARSELLDRGTFNVQLYRGYAGLTDDRLFVMADEVVDRVLVPNLFPKARAMLQACKDSGMAVVLLSGTPDFLVKRLGERLGLDEALCFGNRLEFMRGQCTGKVLPPVLAGPAKAALMRQLCEQHGWVLSQCFAYSNDAADAPMLSMVGRPTAVNPDARLRAMASTQRWPVVELR